MFKVPAFFLRCHSELSAMGPVQFNWPCGVAKNEFTKPEFWERFVDIRKNPHAHKNKIGTSTP